MSRQRNKNKLTNDLDSDAEINDREDVFENNSPKEKSIPSDPEDIFSKKNSWVLGIFIVVAVLWHFDWSPMKAAYGIGTSITNLFESEEQVNVAQNSVTQFSQLEYFDSIKDLDFDDSPTIANTSLLYQNNVPVQYLLDLENLDYLSELSPNQVLALYNSGVTSNFLEVLEDLDYLDEVSYTGVVGMYTSGVSESYLTALEAVDYLEDLSYSQVIALYSSGVSEDFLRKLESRDLLEDLSYTEVIRLNNQN